MDRRGAETSSFDGLPTDFDQMELSEQGLDWGDISLIRDKLALTPTERLRAAQSFMHSVFTLRNAKRS